MKKLLLALLIFAVAAGAYYKDLVVGETAGDQVVINRAEYNIICGGTATNPLTIADGGAVFLLTGNWVPNSVGDNITVRCIDATPGAHVFVEVARSNN